MRTTVVAIAAVFAVVLAPSGAQGHSELRSADPEPGSRVASSPDQVVLLMTETPVEAASEVVVLDGCREPVEENMFTEGKTIHVEIVDGAQPGRWKVEYNVLSGEDGHAYEDGFAFRVRGQRDCSAQEDEGADGENDPGGEEPDSAAPDTDTGDEGSDFPVVPVVIGAGALIGIAALVRGVSGKS